VSPPRPPRAPWDWQGPAPVTADAVRTLQSALGVPTVIAEVLVRRGYDEVDVAKDYFRPRLRHLSDPWALPDVGAAVERLREARARGETVLVHGDYDADGVCGAALLVRGLRALDVKAEPFVPHRLEDGYDLGPAGLVAARTLGARLILTCDCGTTAVRAVADARAAGIDVIVTDHHVPGAERPAAAAVVNPMRAETPGDPLCGTGVAYKLLEALFEAEGRARTSLYKFLDLVAIATVADQVPLVNENRAFVRFGLRLLRETRNPGLGALLKVVGLHGRGLSARHAAFVFGPRLNAAGRMGSATRGLSLLLARDEAEAWPFAEALDGENRVRQEVDRRTFHEALEILARDYDPERDYALVLAKENWHPGVIGIVASRIVQEVFRPTVLIALGGERGKGSGRSIPGFHLYEALRACARHLDRFGGHKGAAGLEILAGELDAFRDAFAREARARLTPDDLRPVLAVDAELSPSNATREVWRFARHMGPFGLGNEAPLFLARDALAVGPIETVAGHLRLRLADARGGAPLPAIGFGLAETAAWVRPQTRLDIVYRLQDRGPRGPGEPEAVLLDLRAAGT
jgi:single-stranded-DNA-specific exonuclease